MELTVGQLIEELQKFDKDAKINMVPCVNDAPLKVLDNHRLVYNDVNLSQKYQREPNTVYIGGK